MTATMRTMALLAGCAFATTLAADGHAPFFENLERLCGGTYAGTTVVDRGPGDQFTGAVLVAGPVHCTPGEIRIPLAVDDDTSRTWIIRHEGGELTLKHDHRYPDGTPHETTDYGGIAVPSENPSRRVFPSDPWTLDNLPRTEHADWVLELRGEPAALRYELRVSENILFAAEFPLDRD